MTDGSKNAEGMWDPIEGVSLDQYAALIAEILKQGIFGRDRVEQFVTARGITPGAWSRAEAGWIARIGRHRAVRTRYTLMYATATGSPMAR